MNEINTEIDESKITFECPICLDNIKYASIGSCTHHFCFYCLYKHCQRSNECPMCKAKIYEIKFDREFDNILNRDSLPTLKYDNETIIYQINTIKNPGITIANNTKGPGVIVKKIKESGLFKQYSFKNGDVILFINDIPCTNHVNVMEQIMFLHNSNKPMKCILLK